MNLSALYIAILTAMRPKSKAGWISVARPRWVRE